MKLEQWKVELELLMLLTVMMMMVVMMKWLLQLLLMVEVEVYGAAPSHPSRLDEKNVAGLE